MAHRANPVRPGQRLALSIGNRYQRHIRKFSVERGQIRQIEPAMQRRQAGYTLPPAQRKVQIIDVEVYEVELVRHFVDPFNHQNMVCKRVHAVRIEPEGLRASRNESSVRYRVATGKQGYIMSE